nr:hypothetical protein [Tanacetum cinerariifolium]
SFEKLMKDKFQMSSMGELTFFLGLRVKQKKDGIFISQNKYVAEILRKFGLTEGKSASTLIDTEKPLLKDPDVCACARFQVTPKALHLHAVKRIFRYLKGKPHLGLWYLKDLPFDLVAYSDSDYAGVNTPRSDEDRLEILKLTVFVLPQDESTEIGVIAASLKVTAVRHKLLLFVWLIGAAQLMVLALDTCAALTSRIEQLESAKMSQALEISKLKKRVKRLEKSNKFKVFKLHRLKKVGTSQRIDTSDDTIMEDVSNQRRMINDSDRDEGVALTAKKEEEKKTEEAKNSVGDDQVKGRQAEIYQIYMDHPSKVLSMQEDEPTGVEEVVEVVTTAKLITKVVVAASKSVGAASTTIPAAEPQVPAATPTAVPSKDKDKGIIVEEPKPMKKKKQVEMDKEYARKLHKELNQDIDWDVAVDHVKQKAKEDPYVQRYQEKIEEEENRALESINETPSQKATKRMKLNEEVAELNKYLEIVPDEDDDVFTEATLLARKVPDVDYSIIFLNNKPHYKIVKACISAS